MKKLSSLIPLLVFCQFCFSESLAQPLPLKEWNTGQSDKPLVFYITGDGGLNDFSLAICKSFATKDYNVVALDAKAYFNEKKTPEKTTSDIYQYLQTRLASRNNRQAILIGYSFGADVLPFIINRLPADLLANVKAAFIISPSGSTDFEIHWSDLLGGKTKRTMDVVNEINRLSLNNIVIINGSDEDDLNFEKITLKKYSHEVLPGGHHYSGKTENVAAMILRHSR